MKSTNNSSLSRNDFAFSWQGGMAHAVEVFDRNGNTVALVSNTMIGSNKDGSYYCIGNPSDLKNIPGLAALDISAHYAFLMTNLPAHPRDNRFLTYERITAMLANPKTTIVKNSGFRTDTPLHTCLDVTASNPTHAFRILRIDNVPVTISGPAVKWGLAAFHSKKVTPENMTMGMHRLLALSAYDRAFGNPGR